MITATITPPSNKNILLKSALGITSSIRGCVDAGSTSPLRRLSRIKNNPKEMSLLRGQTNSWNALLRLARVTFFFSGLDI
jgi:hypothetical protein